MKFTFTQEEKSFLTARLQTLSELIMRFPIPTPGERSILKMKGKFSPNSTQVSLGKKERVLLRIMLERLLKEHNKIDSISPELDLIRAIILKIL